MSTMQPMIRVSSLTLAVVLAPLVLADGNAATDSVPRLLPYSGVLERDGVPVSATVKMVFKIFDGSDQVWIEAQNVQIYAGRFSVMLGECRVNTSVAVCPDGVLSGATIETVVQAADDLQLGIELITDAGAVPMQQRKRLSAVPFALWSPASSDLHVAHTLTVEGTSDLKGAVTTGSLTTSGSISATGDISATGINLSNNGTSTLFEGIRISHYEVVASGATANRVTDSSIPVGDAMCFLSQCQHWQNGGSWVHNDCEVISNASTWRVRAVTHSGGDTYAHTKAKMTCWRYKW